MRFRQPRCARPAWAFSRIQLIGWACVFVILGAPGCTEGELDSGRALLAVQAATNRTIWEDAAITDYEFVYQRSCFCVEDFLRPLRIQVRGGTVSAVTFFDTGEAVTNTALGPFPTLDGVFDDLQSQLIQADNVNASFHPQYGFPTQYIVDRETNTADEEYSITISRFGEL